LILQNLYALNVKDKGIRKLEFVAKIPGFEISSSFKDTGIIKYTFEKNSQFLHENHLILNYWFKLKGTLWYEYFTNK